MPRLQPDAELPAPSKAQKRTKRTPPYITLAAALVLGAALLPARVGWACSSCLSAAEGTREAYYGTTLLLIVVPFLSLGILVLWLRRAAQRAERARLEASDSRATAEPRRGAALVSR